MALPAKLSLTFLSTGRLQRFKIELQQFQQFVSEPDFGKYLSNRIFLLCRNVVCDNFGLKFAKQYKHILFSVK
jgi:hypothetical protein